MNEACQLLAEDLPLAPGTPGGQIEYRRSLASSFFFKFYLNVSLQLSNQEVRCHNLDFLLDKFSHKSCITSRTNQLNKLSNKFSPERG